MITYHFSLHIEYWQSTQRRDGIICREFVAKRRGASYVNGKFYLPLNWMNP